MTDPNDPAHSITDTVYPNGQVQPGFVGLTKREYFAALAMQGLMMNEITNAQCAEIAIQQADALIEALNSKKEEK